MRLVIILGTLFVFGGTAHGGDFKPSALDPYARLGFTDPKAATDAELDRCSQEAPAWVAQNVAPAGQKRALEKLEQAIRQLRDPALRRRVDEERKREAATAVAEEPEEEPAPPVDSYQGEGVHDEETRLIRLLGYEGEASKALAHFRARGVSTHGVRLLFEMILLNMSPTGAPLSEENPYSARAAENASIVFGNVLIANLPDETIKQMRSALWRVTWERLREEAHMRSLGIEPNPKTTRQRDTAHRRAFSALSLAMSVNDVRSFLATIVEEPDAAIREDLRQRLIGYPGSRSAMYTALVPALNDPEKRDRALALLRFIPRSELPKEVRALLPKRPWWCWVLETFWD